MIDDATLLYFEDLHIGRRFVTGEHTMHIDEILAFARQYDPQPFHTDAVAARDTFFGELVASGWHTALVSIRLQVDSGAKIAGGLIGAGGELTWPMPTRPGDVLRVESEVMAARASASRPERGLVTMRNDTLNHHNELVQRFTVTLVVPVRNPAP